MKIRNHFIYGITFFFILLFFVAVDFSYAISSRVNQANLAVPTTVFSRKSNIIFIRTDDDVIDSLNIRQPNGKLVLQYVNDLLAKRGTTFANNYVSLSLCCPSRSTTLTGQYAHNHHVLSNNAPTGGYTVFDPTNALPVWLTNAGYYNVHIGKYLNEYNGQGIPPGWNEWYTSGIGGNEGAHYFNYTLNENGTTVSYGSNERDYATDVYTHKAVNFIKQQPNGNSPFFLQVDYTSPHNPGPILGWSGGPVPAPRHLGIMSQYTPTFPPSFNEIDVSDKPQNIQNLASLTQTQTDGIITFERHRLEALMSVDEGVRDIVGALAQKGELANTYIVFTSDNGIEQGQHRIPQGKEQVYEESNKQYLIIRGPDVAPGAVRNEFVANIDLAPTFADWAHATPLLVQDGHSLVPLLTNTATSWRQGILLETFENPFYKAIRTPDYMYAEYDYNHDGIPDEKELYNFVPDSCRATADPYELDSQHANPCYAQLIVRLHQQLAVLETCAGATCQ